mmetsp:Transcript_2228/g.5283  ORF Transcript_2228/g.5283 Transcript_2228/m.5283 type:complete len:148 (+) Transcript_2228:68-511(+)
MRSPSCEFRSENAIRFTLNVLRSATAAKAEAEAMLMHLRSHASCTDAAPTADSNKSTRTRCPPLFFIFSFRCKVDLAPHDHSSILTTHSPHTTDISPQKLHVQLITAPTKTAVPTTKLRCPALRSTASSVAPSISAIFVSVKISRSC